MVLFQSRVVDTCCPERQLRVSRSREELREVAPIPQEALDDKVTKEAKTDFYISVRQLDLTRLSQRLFIAIFQCVKVSKLWMIGVKEYVEVIDHKLLRKFRVFCLVFFQQGNK